jgi:hypothetical protein
MVSLDFLRTVGYEAQSNPWPLSFGLQHVTFRNLGPIIAIEEPLGKGKWEGKFDGLMVDG